ncbi:(Fe-S)-binding protein [Lysobacter brunescens]|uniref:Glycolate oxidase iron-sulfur subunit n=1 Tax=Lysobacter brunescens TaxID=262323 RepID=A0ABW2YA87_9GAMM
MTDALPCPDPDTPSLQALTDRCVQCGLCLPTCPTYTLDGLESESPRGRIALARALDDGRLVPTPATDAHLDHCLGCRRCEAVCPARVEFGAILVRARAGQRARRRPGLRQRGAEWLAARPQTLSSLLGLYRRAWPLLPEAARPLPRPPARPMRAMEKADGPAVAIFTGCVARSYETGLHAAIARLLAALGQRAVFPDGQGCCGALHAHAGDADTAAALAARNRAAFAGIATVLTLASGCHEAVAGAVPGARDAIDHLAEHADSLRFVPRPERVALHLPCSQRNVVGSDATLRRLLARVPGLEIVVLDAGFGCCGAAGTQMLTNPERADRFRQPLLAQLAASGATRLLSANIGCRLHLGRGITLPVQHPLELLADGLA